MRLERLEVRGFKSFRDKTVIEFPSKFMAIVGPNGSGKSNLTEAVCFVLGKSRGLRANVLEELIFNGAKEGSPASKTVVSIVLRDENGESYKISRMVDREGRSLYKLNDQRVTRDKVVDIIGDNEYNIILQDDVTKVIEMKPAERRVIIDDLCGIAEYDKKKAKSMKELEKVEDRISETHIILGEKQAQLIRLGKERDDALKYRSVQDELKSNQASLLHHNIVKAEKRVGRLDEKTAEINREKEGKSLKNRELKGKIAVEQGLLKDISRKIVGLEEGKRMSRFTELSSDIRGFEERVNSLGERESSVASELSEYNKKRASVIQEIKAVEEELPGVAQQIEDLSKKILHESGKASDAGLEKEVEDAQVTVLELKSREKALAESAAERREIISRSQLEESEVRKEVDLSSTDRFQVAKQITEFEESYRVREKDHAKLKEDLSKNKERLAKIEEELEGLQLTQARKKTHLKTTEEAGGGVKGAVKAVMRLKDVLPGIHGTVSQLGVVADEKFEVALQVAAGARLQNIVVDDVKVASKCIDYLKKKQIGRATFLPLDKIQVKVSDKPAENTLGFARDYIKADKKYSKVFEYVFGDTLVAEDLGSAQKTGVGKHRMVTLAGELLEKSGALTGGHITREVEIGFSNLEELEKEIGELDVRISRLTEQKESVLADVVQAEAKLMDYQKLVDEKTEVEKLRIEQKRVDEKILELKKTLKKIADNKKSDEEKIKAFEKELLSCETRRKTAERNLSKLLEERKKYDTSGLDELKRKETELKVRQSSLTEKKRNLKEQLTESDIKITRLHEEKKQITEEKTFKAKELSELKKELSVVEEESATIGGEIKKLLDERDKTEGVITDLSAESSTLDYELSELSQKISDVLVEKAKAETELETLRNDFKKFEGAEIIEAPATQIERSIMTLERQLEGFGSINMKSIEAYDVAHHEYDDVEGKLNTLKAERQSIFDFMEEVERKKHEVFMKTFTTVKQNFEDIFARLSEGEGTLILDNPKDISESGLLIKASPAGKKIMNLEAMSGGEKVLTSGAFLLAIQQYKPSQFYIIDELDAALDKKNSIRLAEMLSESDAQFILVTHNNSIVRQVESVVGVSMQNGVSNIVEVKLEEKAS